MVGCGQELRQEAEFYGLLPLLKKLSLCADLHTSGSNLPPASRLGMRFPSDRLVGGKNDGTGHLLYFHLSFCSVCHLVFRPPPENKLNRTSAAYSGYLDADPDFAFYFYTDTITTVRYLTVSVR